MTEDLARKCERLEKELEGLRNSIPLANQKIAERQREMCAEVLDGPDEVGAAAVRATPLVTEKKDIICEQCLPDGQCERHYTEQLLRELKEVRAKLHCLEGAHETMHQAVDERNAAIRERNETRAEVGHLREALHWYKERYEAAKKEAARNTVSAVKDCAQPPMGAWTGDTQKVTAKVIRKLVLEHLKDLTQRGPYTGVREDMYDDEILDDAFSKEIRKVKKLYKESLKAKK